VAGFVNVQDFALEIPVLLTSNVSAVNLIYGSGDPVSFFLVVGSVFVAHAVFMLNLIVRGAGNWLLQNTSVTSKTAWCYHRWDAHSLEPQISLHAVCTSVMSLSVRKYSI